MPHFRHAGRLSRASRTANRLKGIERRLPNVHHVEPLGYLEFNHLVKHSKCVITDSGGVTEEAM